MPGLQCDSVVRVCFTLQIVMYNDGLDEVCTTNEIVKNMYQVSHVK